MATPYYERYRKIEPTGPKQDREREKQNALTAREGWVHQPRDFDWLEKNIPCQAACPAGTDIPGYLDAIAHGHFDEAYRINLRDNVFPAVLGRVCTRPCEPACRHGWEGLGEPVAICFSKRSAADFMAANDPVKLDPMYEPTGKTITVVGSGAAGLAAARELALLGHDVTVLERDAEPGGMMVQGIPEFRLPREIVRREIEQIEICGVTIACGVEIGKDRDLADLSDQSDAVIIAAGMTRPRMPDLPGSSLGGVVAGFPFLQMANRGEAPRVGRKVVVIGGGFTAVDCARMAKRLGAESVTVYYRRTRDEMYITPGEVEEMMREGIAFEAQVMPVGFEGTESVERVCLVRTEPGETGEDGRRGFNAVAGSEFDVEADMVLLATGQVRENQWPEEVKQELDPPGTLYRVQDRNIFLAGDFRDGAGSLIHAVGSGKACAWEVDEFLMGRRRVREAGFVENVESTGRTREMDELPRQEMPVLDVADRGVKDEVEAGYERAASQTEASRCYLCSLKFEIDNDLCIYCDRCLKVKPVENCIVKVSALRHDDAGRITGYDVSTSGNDYNLLYIDQSECIRCGACRDVCPVECITLQKVTRTCVGL